MSDESSSENEAASDPEALAESLLRAAPTSVERRPGSRWVYPLWGVLLVSVFVAFHTAHLSVWNTPGKGLAKTFHKTFLDKGYGVKYFNAARLSQSWAMFAPNPNRSNTFMRVFVTDMEGDLWDFQQDIWGIDRYPYLWYDRRGKVNRRLNNKKHYQRIYGAWVCREWERQNDGQPAKSVTFYRRYTKIPHWDLVIKKGGWDQWAAPYKQKEQETITCKTTVNAQLPPYLRERYGFEPTEDESAFRSVRQRTWWDKAEAARKKVERKVKSEERRAEADAKREARTTELRSRRIENTPKPEPMGPLRDSTPDLPASEIED